MGELNISMWPFEVAGWLAIYQCRAKCIGQAKQLNGFVLKIAIQSSGPPLGWILLQMLFMNSCAFSSSFSAIKVPMVAI